MAVVLGAVILLWAPILNGQPFFHPDTGNYFRAPDTAAVKLLGSRFASPWTDPEVKKILGLGVSDPNPNSPPEATELDVGSSKGAIPPEFRHTNSLKDRVILAGRSVYYGSLLYISERVGGLWLAVLVQSLIVSYVIFLLMVRCLSSSVRTYIFSIALIACFSTASFYVGSLMPDIFAAVTILATILVLAFWDKLTTTERTILAIILAFSVMCHLTHLLICVSIVSAYALTSNLSRFSSGSSSVAPLVTVAVCILAGALGEAAFGVVVSHLIGVAPIRPPFLTARLVDLGPGYEFLKARCDDHKFIVCQYLDRLPLTTDDFIWSQKANLSVFATASAETKRALGDEQFAFLWNVILFDPFGVLRDAVRAGLTQLVTFSVSESNYIVDTKRGFVQSLPVEYLAGLQNSLSFRNIWPAMALDKIYGAVLMLSLALVSGISAICIAQRSRKPELLKYFQIRDFPIWFCCGVGLGVVANALICGSFSALHDRYEARVIWLVPLMAIVLLSRVRLSKTHDIQITARQAIGQQK
jgi:hypothetical protein